jgi:hypothetical protein
LSNVTAPRVNPARFWVYVVELAQEVLQNKRFRDANPDRVEGMACYSFGMTALTPEERFENRRRGYKACRFVTEFGLALMPRGFAHHNPRTFDAARRLKRRFARRLRNRGHAVWQR